jgi:hypothetical protein
MTMHMARLKSDRPSLTLPIRAFGKNPGSGHDLLAGEIPKTRRSRNHPTPVVVSRPMNTLRPAGRTIAGLVSFALLLAACSSAAAPSTQPTAAPSASPIEPSPDAPVTALPSDGAGGGASGDPGIGVGAKPVFPKPGQAIDIHPIAAEQLAARVDGNKIIVNAVWTSGVEPCTILDSIVVAKGEGTYTITLQEGSSPQEIACIALAEQHVTEFEIPDVAAGDWTISDSGGVAPPVTVTVS